MFVLGRRRFTIRQRPARGPAGAPTIRAMTEAISGHPRVVVAVLLAWVVIYLVYKVAWRRDFGLPVRRRLLLTHLLVERDQIAFVPFWWSDLQIQRAVDEHWKRTMRKGFERRRAY